MKDGITVSFKNAGILNTGKLIFFVIRSPQKQIYRNAFKVYQRKEMGDLPFSMFVF